MHLHLQRSITNKCRVAVIVKIAAGRKKIDVAVVAIIGIAIAGALADVEVEVRKINSKRCSSRC